MSDGEREEEELWPPDKVLEFVGLSREEWDEMADEIQADTVSKNEVIQAALEKAVRRRASESDRYL